jgi:hypothetical protein
MVAFTKEWPRKRTLPGPVLRLFEFAQAYAMAAPSDSPMLIFLGFVASGITRKLSRRLPPAFDL